VTSLKSSVAIRSTLSVSRGLGCRDITDWSSAAWRTTSPRAAQCSKPFFSYYNSVILKMDDDNKFFQNNTVI
jgi:hypothetical protein